MELLEIYRTLYAAGAVLGVADKEELAQTILCRAVKLGVPLESYRRKYWLVAARNYAKSEWRSKTWKASLEAILLANPSLEPSSTDDLQRLAEIMELFARVPKRMAAIVANYGCTSNADKVYLHRERRKLREWVAA